MLRCSIEHTGGGNDSMTNVFFNWEPRENTEWGPKISSRVIVDGEAREYPQSHIVRLPENTGFLCTFCPNESEEYHMTTHDWAFTHQTLMMWTIRILASETPGESPAIAVDDFDTGGFIDYLEDTLRKEDQQDESD
jgi:hypothetical protein